MLVTISITRHGAGELVPHRSGWYFKCICGYKGPWRSSKGEAHEDHSLHVRLIAGKMVADDSAVDEDKVLWLIRVQSVVEHGRGCDVLHQVQVFGMR